MPSKLSTTICSISSIPNLVNLTPVYDFYQYMKSIGASQNYQNVNLKIMIYFGRFLAPATDFIVYIKDQILAFLDTSIKDTEIDPDNNKQYNGYGIRVNITFYLNADKSSDRRQ
jgi:hypothetical protein